jgi:hypothetical protein
MDAQTSAHLQPLRYSVVIDAPEARQLLLKSRANMMMKIPGDFTIDDWVLENCYRRWLHLPLALSIEVNVYESNLAGTRSLRPGNGCNAADSTARCSRHLTLQILLATWIFCRGFWLSFLVCCMYHLAVEKHCICGWGRRPVRPAREKSLFREVAVCWHFRNAGSAYGE